MAYSESPKGLQAIPYGTFRIRLYGAKIPEMGMKFNSRKHYGQMEKMHKEIQIDQSTKKHSLHTNIKFTYRD